MIVRTVLFIVVLSVLIGCKKDDEPAVIPPIESSESLLYSANPNGHNELFRLQDGEEVLLLSDEMYDFWWAKVSPDKSKFLVYRSPTNPAKNHDDYENATLMLYDIDGANGQVLIENGAYGWNAQGVCRWNIDGSKILMASDQDVGTGFQWRMVITDALGNNPEVMSDYWVIDPNFSPDNTKIVFIGFPDNSLSLDLTELELLQGDYNADEDTLTNIIRLTNNDTRDHDPSFSPDGTNIVFSSGNVNYSDVNITLYDVVNEIETHVVDDTGSNGGSMCYSLDGLGVYFHSLNLTSYPFRIKHVDLLNLNVSTIVQAPFDVHGVYHPEVY